MEDKKSTELVREIRAMKEEMNAVILAHNYQRDEVQDIADFVGDSLELSRKAAKTDADVIVFCGVRFMAETAAIVNPRKTVLLPDMSAGCPLADMIDEKKLAQWKKDYPKAKVVCYINSSAATKAMCDICCTSANATKIVQQLKGEEILFVPDENLGRYVSSKTGSKMILYPGFCPIHVKLNPEMILAAKKAHPDTRVIVHPECTKSVIELADVALSTSQMLRYAKESSAMSFIVGTEIGLMHRLSLENPSKSFYPASTLLVCPDMKRITLAKVAESMEKRKYVIRVPKEIRTSAAEALEKMLSVS